MFKDPRSVARDIPGVLGTLFPQLVPGVVAHFNQNAKPSKEARAIPYELIASTTLQRAMFFEVAIAAAEQLVRGAQRVDWDHSLDLAVKRQKEHFDAKLPSAALSRLDIRAAEEVACNLFTMLEEIRRGRERLIVSPRIPGFEWIASGVGDFSIERDLIEVKCTNKRFSTADYRQVLMYWLLSYASAIEARAEEWKNIVFVNPRLDYILELDFDELIRVTSAGRSKMELLQLFRAMISTSRERAMH